jgi:polyisoprenoid-binding protein YceI
MTTATAIPGYIAGTWAIDRSHSDVSFTVRHVMISKVRGHFNTFEGTIVTGATPEESSVTATIDLASVSTDNEQRDNHLRSADFFDAANNPTMTFTSTSVTAAGGSWKVVGDLTIKAITKPVTLDLEVNGIGPDPWGGTRIGFSATTEISRKEFGVDLDMPLEGGGVVIGDKISISLEIEGALTPAA